LPTSVEPAAAEAVDVILRDGGTLRLRPPTAADTDAVVAFFGDLSLVEPGLTEVWEWRPDGELVANPSNVMTVIGGVARKT